MLSSYAFLLFFFVNIIRKWGILFLLFAFNEFFNYVICSNSFYSEIDFLHFSFRIIFVGFNNCVSLGPNRI